MKKKRFFVIKGKSLACFLLGFFLILAGIPPNKLNYGLVFAQNMPNLASFQRKTYF
jgi:hypothetical protein